MTASKWYEIWAIRKSPTKPSLILHRPIDLLEDGVKVEDWDKLLKEAK